MHPQRLNLVTASSWLSELSSKFLGKGWACVGWGFAARGLLRKIECLGNLAWLHNPQPTMPFVLLHIEHIPPTLTSHESGERREEGMSKALCRTAWQRFRYTYIGPHAAQKLPCDQSKPYISPIYVQHPRACQNHSKPAVLQYLNQEPWIKTQILTLQTPHLKIINKPLASAVINDYAESEDSRHADRDK